MISAPADSTSRSVSALTAPCVPTGMNAGVWTSPCAVVITPQRARPSACVSRNAKDGKRTVYNSSPVKRLRVGVIYGGRSGEHEVSLASAAAVFGNLDPGRYEAVAIRIEKDGRWVMPSSPPRLTSAADVIRGHNADTAIGAGSGAESRAGEITDARQADIVAYPGGHLVSGAGLDVVFPVL